MTVDDDQKEQVIDSKSEMRKDVLQFYRNRRKTMEERERMVLRRLVVMVRRSKSQPPVGEKREKLKFQHSVDYAHNDNAGRNK